MKSKILVVEDASLVALDIKVTLESLNYETIGIAKNYVQTKEIISSFLPDLILMDINLKNSVDGIEIMEKLQEKHDIPAIYLTAYTDEKTIQRAIKTNPVGYIVKPFKAEELHATIQLGLYKSKKQDAITPKDTYIKFNSNYYYDTLTKNAFYNETPIKLSKNEKTLLGLLINAQSNLLTYEELEYHIWPDEPVKPEVLRSLVYRLRAKFDYLLIENITAYGYKLIFEK